MSGEGDKSKDSISKQHVVIANDVQSVRTTDVTVTTNNGLLIGNIYPVTTKDTVTKNASHVVKPIEATRNDTYLIPTYPEWFNEAENVLQFEFDNRVEIFSCSDSFALRNFGCPYLC